MPLVRITKPFAYNLTGNDQHPLAFEIGEAVAPATVAEWLRRNPSYGEVLDDSEEAPPPPERGPRRLPEPSNTEEDGSDLLRGKVAEVVERIIALDDAQRLATLHAIEEQAAKPRKGVLDAIVARLAELSDEGEAADGQPDAAAGGEG